ncbi:cellulose biosynthesis protein BcsS [Methylobacterium pseudosasicola]|uniref:Cellulose biosynthesis protein BcsS n=1 Tax=Methylobacterium pseudosasicola TaxID=582667 RepID=A0A1I4TNA5_9HYPH|nr:cellulose biosynthesis protein BcsS [Methylobacterium pseudosasicola]SFM78262.1 Cellulose biosynthesis protein BcsS [Methylobacterium pseudosasicola]
MRYPSAIPNLVAVLVATGTPTATLAADWYTGAPTDVGADEYIVAIDAAATVTSNSSAFGVVTATIAPVTPLNESGPRLRLQGLSGVYSYPGSTSGRTVRGQQEEGTAMFGYEWIWKQAALAGYVGFNVRSNELSVLDPNNPVAGTGVGAKFAADLYLNPTLETLVAANASYSTLFHAYYVRVKAGFAVADGVFVGPEATLLGDAYFNQWRVGAHLTGFTVGPMKFSLGAGYAHDRVQKGGYYTSVEGRAAF